MSANPLQKYFRQPKLFITLPSKGMYYKNNSLQGDYNSVPIFAMSGMDEIIMKTPDALFNGEATVKLIESCCPYIKNAKEVPSLDVDVLLIAIRIATYGEEMPVNHTCSKCGTENEYVVNLTNILENYNEKEFNGVLEIDDITVQLRPLSYKEMSEFNIENFKLQRMLGQLVNVTAEERQKYLDEIYAKLGEIQVNVFLTSIESIKTPDALVTEKEFIKEWLLNSVNTSYNLIKDKLEKNKEDWEIPKMSVTCDNCENKDEVSITMDQSNFFV